MKCLGLKHCGAYNSLLMGETEREAEPLAKRRDAYTGALSVAITFLQMTTILKLHNWRRNNAYFSLKFPPCLEQ